MNIKIALAGNPNSGKTTLFNALTGSNQFVGNWPGVTVEKREGKLKKHNGVTITDLPGIYSLSPYTLEEVVARNYLIDKRPDAILNIIDGTNLERNLYLTTQLTELGIPVVVAINMMDIVKKNGDNIDAAELSEQLGCKVVEISALKGMGITEAAQAVVNAVQDEKIVFQHSFSDTVEHALAHIKEAAVHNLSEKQQRWYSIKLFERDDEVRKRLGLTDATIYQIEKKIAAVETELEDDAESIITNERYVYISSIIKKCYKKKSTGRLSISDKIDRVVTNRFAALPIFAIIMFLLYYISVSTVGTMATNWVNDGIFGDGWHLLGIGQADYEDDVGEYGLASNIINAFVENSAGFGVDSEDVAAAIDTESESFDAAVAKADLDAFASEFNLQDEISYTVTDEETITDEKLTATGAELLEAVAVYKSYGCEEPDPASYGVYIPGLPVFIEDGLNAIGCADLLSELILDGIVAGVGSVLGFIPQIFVLFILLAFLESCGYMARIAFVLDRVFRKFGLSGKSFIPMLIGSGCGVPGIMASRTIENERDRRMTIITTTFIPCGAKIPFIAMIAGALFGGAWWVAPCAYFIGIAAIIVSGIILKKTKMFAGDPAPFVMELPAYHLPTAGSVLRSTWERCWSFVKKAGTVILLSTIFVWFTTYFGFVDGSIKMLTEEQIDCSILAAIGNGIAWIFTPLGWGNWQAAVASITGLVAKENIVGTMGILYSGTDTVYSNLAASFTALSGFSFLIFNLLCAPCFAAMGAIKREMNSGKWTAFAIAYQCGFAYGIAFIVNQIGSIFIGSVNVIGFIAALIFLTALIYLLLRPYKEFKTLKTKHTVKS